MSIIVKMPEDTPIKYRSLVEQLISCATNHYYEAYGKTDDLDTEIAEILDDHDIPYDEEEYEDL